MNDLRSKIIDAIGIKAENLSAKIEYEVLESTLENGYERQHIEFSSYGDKVTAYLLIPSIVNNHPAVLVNHQHNRERHLGKSEVCGLAGNPLQAFGPALAQKGFFVLAPDSICFEERRKNAVGTTPLEGDADFLQHYNEMCYRLLKGENLMQKVLTDAMNGITLLSQLDFVDKKRIGTLGHSYGGKTVLFLSAIDERIRFSCSSGGACTYENRISNHVGIEMASVIPKFIQTFDIPDLVRCIAPRHLLIVSAEDDKYSRDADLIVNQAKPVYASYQASNHLVHARYKGGHALTKERVNCILNWFDLMKNCKL